MGFVAPGQEPARAVATLRGWLDADDPDPLLIETSGSSGAPKRVVLSRDAVVASARAAQRRLGEPGRWALTLPPSYVAGVQVIVRSLMSGHDPALQGWGDAAYTSLVPTQLHRLLDEPGDVAALRAMTAVLLGGGAIDPALRRRAEEAGIRVVATYGSSETAGGCVYDGVALDGVAVALAPSSGGQGGRIRIAGPVLFDRYDGDPALTAESLVDGWFLTADAGRIDADGRLRVLGRLDDMVVSGGVNVPLAAVAARLREHPDVSAVEVLGIDDEEWGQRVVAYVVGPLDRKTARDWVGEAHSRAWAPQDVVVVGELPLLANGKVDRARLRELR